MKINVNTNWKDFINNQTQQEYFCALVEFLNSEYQSKNIYPKKENVFRCFNFFDYQNTKLVILGQDPYHIPNMADGLAFSTQLSIRPKSLINIFKEIKNDFNIDRNNCDLSDIAKQGVLLLNTCLTVVENKPWSHNNKGWEIFTDNVIKFIDNNVDNVIFLLMGNNAFKKEALIVNNKKHIIKTSHPSPFSYAKSLKGSKTFYTINNMLLSMNKKPIIW